MARLDRSSDGPVPYGPSSRPTGPAGGVPAEEPARDATPWGATPAEAAAGTTAPVGGPTADPTPIPPGVEPTMPGIAPPPPPLAEPPFGGPSAGFGAPPPVAQWAPPPGAYGNAVPGGAGVVYGRTLDRVIAYWLDSILLAIPSFILTTIIVSGAGPDGVARSDGPAVVAAIINAGINLVYFVAFWTGGGRATPAMRLMKLQVGDAASGAVLTVQQGLIRWLALGGAFTLAGVVPVVNGLAGLAGALWAVLLLVTTAMSPTKQGLHDRMAGSALVQPPDAPTPAKACLLIALVLFGIWIVGIVALIFLGGQVSSILSSVGSSI